jgi:hypothetical protein
MRPAAALIAGALAVGGPPSALAQDYSGLRPGIQPDGFTAETSAAIPLFALPDGSAGGTERAPGSLALTQRVTVTEPAGAGGETAFTARLRAGYVATPTVTPFVEAYAAWQPFDERFGAGEPDRAGGELGWRAGLAVQRGQGAAEIAVGYTGKRFDDSTVSAFQALTLDGSLVWTAAPLTRITFAGSTAIGPASGSGSSVIFDGAVDLAYAWSKNLTLSGSATARREAERWSGLVDTNYTAGFSATWKVDRTHHFTAAYWHEWQESSDPSRAHQSDAVRVELRMKR